MTNGWIDIKNTDMMLIMGGNPAENHPCGFKWPIEAKLQRNAKMIVVDPRFTRTAATADLFLQIRAGADIAFLGGLINYAIEQRPHRQRLPRQLHERRVHRQGRLQAARRRAVFGVRCRDAGLRQVDVELRGGAARSGEARQAAQARPRSGGTKPRGRLGTQAQGPAGAKALGRRCAPASHAAERRLRSVAAASALRLPTAQAAVLALHAGDGRADHRHPARISS